jgi:(p)ppGpp synthase/HD superfamily hydrolase
MTRFISNFERARYERALAFAEWFHKGHMRKYTNDPYIVHPVAVAELVSHCPARTIEMMQAALLHDTLEDTSASESDIEANFGPDVLRMVLALTDERFGQDKVGNRKSRKEQTLVRLSHEGYDVQTIKLADMIDNSKSIIVHDPHFAKVFMREKSALLGVLSFADRHLQEVAITISNDYEYDRIGV